MRGLGDGGTQAALKGVSAVGVWGWPGCSVGVGPGRGVSAVRRWDCAGGRAQGALMPPGGHVGTPHWGPQCHRGGGKAAVEHSCCGCRAVGLPIRHCSMLGHGGLHRPIGTSAQAAAVATLISGCVLTLAQKPRSSSCCLV